MDSYKSIVYDLHNNNPKGDAEFTKYITIAMFFDGTDNNYYNVLAREMNTAAYQKHKNDSGGNNSYTNDHSNVDNLWQAMNPDFQKVFCIYIEGIGTEDNQGDDTDGSASGSGDRGILAKVKKGCQKAAKEIDCTTKINVTFDVFGFSRGAAAARNFVYEICKKEVDDKRLTKVVAEKGGGVTSYYEQRGAPKAGLLGSSLQKKFSIDKINSNLQVNVRFVGLYDTVVSFNEKGWKGIAVEGANNDKNIRNLLMQGVRDLHLNEGINRAQKLLHLVAADECREFFASTPTNKGTTIVLPGVHSDIGGSYMVNSPSEKGQMLMLEPFADLDTIRDWFFANYWFRKDNRQMSNSSMLISSMGASITVKGLKGSRDHVRNEYSNIPLQIMRDHWLDAFKNSIIKIELQGKYAAKDIVPQTGQTNRDAIKNKIETKLHEMTGLWKQGQKANSIFGISALYALNPAPTEIEDLCVTINNFLYGTFTKPEDASLNNLNKAQDSGFLNELLCNTLTKINKALHEMESGKKGYENPFTVKKARQLVDESDIQYGTPLYGSIPDSMTGGIVMESLTKNMNKLADKITDQIFFRILRNECLHWSANYNTLTTIIGDVQPNIPHSTDFKRDTYPA